MIYPNPTADFVSMEWSGTINVIEVTDVRGRILHHVEVSEVNELQLDVATYSSGVYLVRIIGDHGTAVYDLIKR